MKCPKCQSDMETVSIRAHTLTHEIEVDRCNSCKGIWFDEFELSDAKNLEGAESIDIGDSNSGKEQNQNDLIYRGVVSISWKSKAFVRSMKIANNIIKEIYPQL